MLVHDEKHPRAFWKLGRVEQLINGQDGNVRGAVIRVHSNPGSRILRRPSQMLYLLEIGCEDVIGGDRGVTVPKVPTDKEAPERIAAVKARLWMCGLKTQLRLIQLTSYSLVNGEVLDCYCLVT